MASGNGQIEVTHGKGTNLQGTQENSLEGWTYSIFYLSGDYMRVYVFVYFTVSKLYADKMEKITKNPSIKNDVRS